jgi:hypothetical protein
MVLAISAAEPVNVLGGGCVESVVTPRTHLRFWRVWDRRLVELEGMGPSLLIRSLVVAVRRRSQRSCRLRFSVSKHHAGPQGELEHAAVRRVARRVSHGKTSRNAPAPSTKRSSDSTRSSPLRQSFGETSPELEERRRGAGKSIIAPHILEPHHVGVARRGQAAHRRAAGKHPSARPRILRARSARDLR